MTDSVAAQPALAPSEVVFLHADRFAPKDTVLTSGVELLLREGKVAVRPLAESLLAAALLANAAAGALRLEIRPRKALFGLLTRKPLVAEPTGVRPAWPDGSLEAAVLQHLGDAAKDVDDLLVSVLEEDHSVPGHQVCNLVRRGLRDRGLLEARETRTLKILKTTVLVPAAGLAELADRAGCSAEQRLLQAAQEQKQEEWLALGKAIRNAMSRRTEMDTSD